MPRLGSGKRKKPDELYSLLDADRPFLEDLKKKATDTFKSLSERLQSIFTAEASLTTEVWDVKTSSIQKVKTRPSFDVQVKAGKLLKELIVDKALSDKRDRKEDVAAGEEGYAAELRKAERRINAEKKAREKGIKDRKVLPISKTSEGGLEK